MVQKSGVMKEMKVAEKGPMYINASVRACMAAINMKRASVLDLISQATYIRSEKLKKRTLPDMVRGNQISNAVGTGPKVTQDDLRMTQDNPLVTQDDPWMTQDDLWMTQDNHLVTKNYPWRTHDDHYR